MDVKGIFIPDSRKEKEARRAAAAAAAAAAEKENAEEGEEEEEEGPEALDADGVSRGPVSRDGLFEGRGVDMEHRDRSYLDRYSCCRWYSPHHSHVPVDTTQE